MNENIKDRLDEEIIRAIEDLNDLEDGTDEKIKAAQYIQKLIEIDEADALLKEQRNSLPEKQVREAEQNKKENVLAYAKLGIEVIGILVPAAIYAVWLKRGFEFEKNGVYSSGTFRNLWGRIKPTR